MVKAGMGLHADKVPMNDIVLMAKLLLVAEILYVINLVWTKLSFLMMYYRIFHFPYFKRWAYIIGGFVIAWVICVIFLFIFICVPVQKLWYPEIPGHCINQVGTWIANAVSTIVTDVAILILPIPQVWKLKLHRSEKLALTVAFGLGFLYVPCLPFCALLLVFMENSNYLYSVVFASAYRFSVLFSYSSSDPTYTLAHTVGWTAIEMAAGITSACLPTLRPVVQLISRKLGLRSTIGLFRSTGNGSKMEHTDLKSSGNQSHMRSRSQANGAFYRLDEDSSLTAPTDAKLRPDHGYQYTVTSEPGKGEGDSLSGDEVPLRSITIKKDFSQVTDQ